MAHVWDARKRDARIRQIQALYQSFERQYAIVEREREVHYELSIPLGSSLLPLRLYLPDEFPDVPPQLYTVEQCSHPYVTLTETHQCQIKGTESLRRWDPLTPLGKVLKEIETEMTKRPPIFFDERQDAPSLTLSNGGDRDRDFDLRSISSSGSSNRLDSHAEQPFSSTTNKTSHLPFEMPDLTKLKACELENLLNDESKFFEFFQDLDFIKKHRNIQMELEHTCEILASKTLPSMCHGWRFVIAFCRIDENLSLQHDVEAVKAVIDTLDQGLSSLAHEYDEHYAMQESFFQSHGHEVMLAKMKALISESEQLSERIIEAFKGQREEDVESFITNYRDARKRYHLRSEKYEKLKRDPRFIML